jgi:hypothetical protein
LMRSQKAAGRNTHLVIVSRGAEYIEMRVMGSGV